MNLSINRRRMAFCVALSFLGGIFPGFMTPSIKAATAPAVAPIATVNGTVVDGTGEPLIGATVLVKGTSNGTATDIEGNFTLKNVEGKTLVVSYVGYKTKEVAVEPELKIILEEENSTLDEVVVVGYGTQRKQTLTGSVSQVKGDEVLANKATQSVATALQGTIPGLTITRTSSRPGNEGIDMTLRGGISVNSEANAPMILIDGTEAYQWELSNINPRDIESVSVLKDAAAAIYGTKAAGGVILITTKRGKDTPVKINYSGAVHANFVGKRYPVANGQEWAQMQVLAVENDYKYGADHTYGWKLSWPEETWRALADGQKAVGVIGGAWRVLDPLSDQFDAVYGTTWGQSHTVSVTGGNDKVKAMTSFGYSKDRSLVDVVYDGQQKYNLRSNIDYKYNDIISLAFNLSYDKGVISTPTQGIGQGLQDMYIFPLFNEYGQYYDTFGGNNVLAKLTEGGTTKTTNQMTRLGGTLNLDFNRYVKGLRFQASANFRIRNSKINARSTHVTMYDWAGETVTDDGYPDYSMGSGAIKTQTTDENCNVKNTLYDDFFQTYQALAYYNRSFGEHNLALMAGLTGEKYRKETYYQFRKGMSNDELDDINLGDASTAEATGGRNEVGMISWLGRINYDYAGIYLLEGQFRRDGSSRFEQSRRWANFGGVSAGVRISEIGPFRDMTFLNDLKVRASYGETGSQGGIGNYDYYSTMGYGTTVFGYDGTKVNTSYISSMTSLERTWERVATTNFGIDFSVLGSRLRGSLEYFIRKNNDMLISVTYPATLGATAPKSNSGSFRSNGWEIQLNWNDKIDRVTYSIGFNLADARTKITDYTGAQAIAAGKNSIVEGRPINSIFVYKTDGILQNWDEVNAYYPTINGSGTIAPTQDTNDQLRPGCVKKIDINGDGRITTDDLVYYGDANPHFTFGLNLGAQWNGFDFSAFIQGVGKQNLVREGNLIGPFNSWWMNQNKAYLTDTWREDNTDARFPILSFNGNVINWNYKTYNDINVMNVWYARIKNIAIGYTIPKTALKHVGIDNLRVYVASDNLWELTHVADKFDPEAQASTGQGKIDCYARTLSFGIDLSF